MRYYSSSRCSLPSSLETKSNVSRSQAALGLLKVDGLRVKYVGPGDDDNQAAAIRSNYPAPMDCPLYYFEVEIVSRGQQGMIGIGFMAEDVALHRLPGWEDHSFGYHGDDGCAFSGSGRGRAYGPVYGTGDTIGAMLNRAEKTISFYKNGLDLGVAFTEVNEERLFPCVGMRSRNEEMTVNFGTQPFVADLEAAQAAFRDKVYTSVYNIPLPLISSKGSPLIPQLVHDYLLHHRFWQTASIIAKDLLGSQEGDSHNVLAQDIASRQQVYELVVAGRIEEALERLKELYTGEPLEANPALHFRLKVAQFCEILRGGSSGGNAAVDAGLAFGRRVLAAHSPKTAADEELLADALSLFAYERPEESPCGHLMSQATRVALAEDLNGAIMAHRGLPAASPLERIYQQASVALSELKSSKGSPSSILDINTMCFKTCTGTASGSGEGSVHDPAA